MTIATTTALTDLPKGKKTVVRVYPTSDDFVAPVARHLAKRFQRVAVLYVHDDFGLGNNENFGRVFKSAGGTVTAAEPYELTQSDSRTLIDKILATTPQAVFVTGYGPAFIAIFKHIREANREIPIFTEIGFANPAVLAALGKDADGITFDGTPLELAESKVDAIESFRSRYVAANGKEPYQVAGFAYDSLLAIAEAAARSSSHKPDKASVIALSPFQGSMGIIEFDNEGESRIELRLMTRKEGKTVLLAQ